MLVPDSRRIIGNPRLWQFYFTFLVQIPVKLLRRANRMTLIETKIQDRQLYAVPFKEEYQIMAEKKLKLRLWQMRNRGALEQEDEDHKAGFCCPRRPGKPQEGIVSLENGRAAGTMEAKSASRWMWRSGKRCFAQLVLWS